MTTTQAPIASSFGLRSTADEVMAGHDLSGTVAIVTGGHAGLGLETTRVLAKAGAAVVVGSRDVGKARLALSAIPGVEVVQLDLYDPKSIDAFARTFVESERALDLLINNAGIMATPLTRDARGFESQFATNHLGHFQLTNRLWGALTKAKSARVVALTSFGHSMGKVDLADPNFERRAYDKWESYGQSKSANSLFAVELDRRGQAHGVRAFAVHPGGIFTDLLRYMPAEEIAAAGITFENGVVSVPERFKTIEQGASTTIWCAVSAQLNGMGGIYCEDCNIAQLVPADFVPRTGVRQWAVDAEIARQLWSLSEQLTKTSAIPAA